MTGEELIHLGEKRVESQGNRADCVRYSINKRDVERVRYKRQVNEIVSTARHKKSQGNCVDKSQGSCVDKSQGNCVERKVEKVKEIVSTPR